MKNNDKKNKDIMKVYQLYFENIKNKDINKCPPSGKLWSYFNNELSKKESLRIEEHIDLCPYCLSVLSQLQETDMANSLKPTPIENWEKIENELDQKFYSALESLSVPTEISVIQKSLSLIKQKWEKLTNFFNAPKVLVYAGSLAMLIVIGLYTAAYFSRSDLFYLAEIKLGQATILRQSPTITNELSQGIKFFNEVKYQLAIEHFTAYLRKNPNNFTANYYAGLSFLLAADNGLPGLAYKFNAAKVNKGIKYLDKALQLSDDHQFYQEDCYWYLGKAYLMNNDKKNAMIYFNKILKMNRLNLMRKEGAKELLKKLKQ